MATGMMDTGCSDFTRREVVDKLSLEETSPLAARRLLGSFLVRKVGDQLLRAKIVEAEAYREDDPASHSCQGPTPRSRIMFGPPGYWYIYKCYGLHWMINVVCGPEGSGEAVLIRAAEPRTGEKIMEKNRGMSGKELTNGPGKLAEALAVDESFNKKPADAETRFYLEPSESTKNIKISRRVGIQEGTEREWRFYLQNEFVTETEHNVDA
ncbi:MAG: DNA-3-methyladenine glycosylase [bacterium]